MELSVNLVLGSGLLLALAGAIYRFGKWQGSLERLLQQLTKDQVKTRDKTEELERRVAVLETASKEAYRCSQN